MSADTEAALEWECRQAEEFVASAAERLQTARRPDCVQHVDEAYRLAEPFLIMGRGQNPVHHTAYVLQFMAEILIGPKKHETSGGLDFLKVGMLAALFHDATQGLSKLAKITEAHIEERVPKMIADPQDSDEQKLQNLQEYRDDAVKGRKEHMNEGAKLAETHKAGCSPKTQRHAGAHGRCVLSPGCVAGEAPGRVGSTPSG